MENLYIKMKNFGKRRIQTVEQLFAQAITNISMFQQPQI